MLCGWLRSGVIFGKCAEQGRPVIPTDGERAVLYNEPDELHGLVNERWPRLWCSCANAP